MNTLQKFKRGTIVKLLSAPTAWMTTENGTTQFDMFPEYAGRIAVIEYSYAEKYGENGPQSWNQYSVIFTEDGNSLAWREAKHLEFIAEGGEDEITKALEKRADRHRKNTDLGYIVENWSNPGFNLNSATILFLFSKIGIKSSFSANGEFSAIHSEWMHHRSFFAALFTVSSQDLLRKILNPNLTEEEVTVILGFHDEILTIKSKP